MAERQLIARRVAELRGVVGVLDRAAGEDRDRAIDALRALAIGGVVLGHWLVTALVDLGGGRLTGRSPLQDLPALAPVSWLFQTLAVFFLVGGYVAERGLASAHAAGNGYPRWLRQRLSRLFRPVTVVLGVWSVVVCCLLVMGTPFPTVHLMARLVLSPLWFLMVFAALTALTPLVARLNPLWPLLVVAAVDVARFGPPGPYSGSAWLGWINVIAGWLVPYCLGAAWSRGRFGAHRGFGTTLLVAGAVTTMILVVWCGYPVSMVGVPGAEVSNLNPPTLAAVTFGLAQCGLALLLLDPLRTATRRPMVWAVVALLNLSAMTVFLWHQTALLVVTASGLPFGPLPGLHTRPEGPEWFLARLGWLSVMAIVLIVCWVAFSRFEWGGSPSKAARVIPGSYAGKSSPVVTPDACPARTLAMCTRADSGQRPG